MVGALLGVPPWYVPPGDFCQYCIFQPWPKDKFEKQKKLADAIHGKVYLYTRDEGGERRTCVVKKMDNKNVLLRQGLLEDARVEIGVSAYLTKQRSDLVPAVVGVVEMQDVFQDDTYTYFVTELASGGELFNHVKDKGAFPEDEVRRFAKQLFQASLALHQSGVVHRDISLENVLVHGDGGVRLVDFGQAVPVWDRMGKPATYTGRASKQYYRAPEMNSPNYEGRPVDVFAMGVLIFIMVVGTPPWDSAMPHDQRWRYIQANGVAGIIRAWRLGGQVSPVLVDLLSKLLAENPENRPTMEGALAHEWFTGPA